MKYCYLLISLMLILSGCAQKKLSEEQLASEKKNVEARIQQMMDGMSKEDSTSLMELISPTEFLAFGVDSAEVIKGRSAWRDLMNTDFVLFDKFAFSRPRILSVSLSDNADLASSLLEVPVDMGIQGRSSHALARFAQTWRKENGK